MPTITHDARVARPQLGRLLSDWRKRRNYSQLALALEANVSQRHLSFVESGRTQPSREMVLRLAERLEIPLRERNRLLLAAGYAPAFPEHPLSDPALGAVREAVERVLAAHEPYPALAVDRAWNLMAANRALAPLLGGAAAWLLEPPVNVLRLALHPEGIARRVLNFAEWRAHLIERLGRQAWDTADETVAALLKELEAYPPPPGDDGAALESEHGRVFVPLRLAVDGAELSFISTTTVFGTPLDVTVAELALECFYPADAATGAWLRAAAGD